MRKTRTIDYAIVLFVQIYAVLETGAVLGQASFGATPTTPGTIAPDEPCRVAFVMISAETV